MAWAILLLFHPSGEGKDIYQDLHDQVSVWMVVHLGMLVFIPLFAVVVYVLLRDIAGTAARVSRVALVFFVVSMGRSRSCRGSASAPSLTS